MIGQVGRLMHKTSHKKKITYTDFVFVYVKVDGGDEENRTPVRKPFGTAFYGRRLSFEFPALTVGSQTERVGSFIKS